MQGILIVTRRYISLLFAILILICVGFYYYLASLSFHEERILYLLVIFYRTTGIYMVCVTLLCLLAIVVYILRKKPFDRQEGFVITLSLILLIIAVPFSCVATIPLFAEGGYTFTHIDNVGYDEYSYQLAFANNPSYGQANYYLYRCDSLGFICDRVQELDVSIGTSYEIFGNYQVSKTVALMLNSDETLSVQSHNKLLFIYSLQS